MSELRFVGGVSIAYGAALAVVAAVAVALLYYRQYRHTERIAAGLVLTVLRVLAVALVLLMLTGPVWHREYAIPERGRVLVLVDESQSMGTADQQTPDGKKLLAARALGWLPERFDRELQDTALTADTFEPAEDANLRAALKRYDETTRWERAKAMLTDGRRGLLSRLAEQHDVELLALGADALPSRWSSRGAPGSPPALATPANVPRTNLSLESLPRLRSNRSTVVEPGAASDTGQRCAVVLLTDGRHNSGPSPSAAARQLGATGVPVYAIGMGSETPPPDLAIMSCESPMSVFRDDQFRGRLVFQDRMPPGKDYTIRVGHEGQVLWEQALTTSGAGTRTVEFGFPIRDLVEREVEAAGDALRNSVSRDRPVIGTSSARIAAPTADIEASSGDALHVHSVPLALQVRISPVAGEQRQDNNAAPLHLRALSRRNRLLLLDGRPRWETRYLRNLFERDPRWQIRAVLAGTAVDTPELPRGKGENQFPADRDELMGQDVIVLGDLDPQVFRGDELQWLKDYVELRGGGLILLDGSRQGLKSLAASSAGELIPVKRLPDGGHLSGAAMWRLTPAGQTLPAMRLAADHADNAMLWEKLPPPHQTVFAEAMPGTETLAEIADAGRSTPALVLRRFGAGRILYSACDETWRWRREVADLHHQRFWMQIVPWLMEEPFAVSDAYVSLDVGSVVYEPGGSATIRVRLRGEDGRPIERAAAEAVLWLDGQLLRSVALEADASGGGVFRALTGPLESGQYEVGVRVAGFPLDQFRPRTRFRVESGLSPELVDLACNRELLEEICRLTGGQYLREDQFQRLPEMLHPLAADRIVASDIALWQSYWWFVPILLLLGAEWLIRKRTGFL